MKLAENINTLQSSLLSPSLTFTKRGDAVGKLLTLKRRCKLNREIIWLSLSSVSGVPFQPRNRNAFSLYSLFYYIYRFASRRSKNGDNLGYCSHESVSLLDILSRGRFRIAKFRGWKFFKGNTTSPENFWGVDLLFARKLLR